MPGVPAQPLDTLWLKENVREPGGLGHSADGDKFLFGQGDADVVITQFSTVGAGERLTAALGVS